MAACALRGFGRAYAVCAFAAQGGLHYPVLNGVIGDDREASAFAQRLDCPVKSSLQVVQLPVHRDAYCLKRSCCGVYASPWPPNRFCDYVRQLRSGSHRAVANYRPRDSARAALFAEPKYDVCDGLFRIAVHNFVGGQRLGGIEAHIQRRFVAEAEAPCAHIQLQRRQP